MATSAQCPACSTRFRVVPDQLKISKGWVRCGKCSEVFDARLSLSGFGPVPDFLRLDPTGADAVPEPSQVSILLRQESEESPEPPTSSIDAVDVLLDLPDPVTEPEPKTDSSVTPLPTGPAEPKRIVPPAEDPSTSDAPSGTAPASDAGWTLEGVPRSLLQAAEASMPPEPISPVDSGPEPDPEPETQAETERVGEAPVSPEGQTQSPESWRHEVPEPNWVVSAPQPLRTEAVRPAPTVGFVRQARRNAFWQRAAVRLVLMGLICLLALGLLLQGLMHERDRLAAHWPLTRPLLTGLCEWVGCQVQPVRHIEAVSIASTDLTRLKTGSYRFDVVLRNASDIPLAVPWVELAFTNRQSETVSSRVILPSQWLTPLAELPAKADAQLSVQLQWQAPDAAATDGFRAEIFYP